MEPSNSIRAVVFLSMLASIPGAADSLAEAENPWPTPPGVVVAAAPVPNNLEYIGSPSMLIMPDGSYLASHDFFGHRFNTPTPKSKLDRVARIYSSRDKGATWTQIAEVPEMTWGTMFLQKGVLHIMGMTTEYGNVVIRRSRDGGRTWTTPVDGGTGLLREGRFHSSAVPIVFHGGRVWRALERYTGDGSWSGRFFGAMVLSAPTESDLLNAKSWRETNAVMFDGDWVQGDRTGWLEGNVVAAPDGSLVNILRVQATPSLDDRFELSGPSAGIPRYEVAAMMQVAADGRSISFDPEHGFFQFPGSQSKFTIRHDPVSGRYWSLVQKITNVYSGYHPDYLPNRQRNVLMLTSSADLRHWTEHYKVLRWNEGLPLSKYERVGFQYVDWQFDGTDIVAVSRTAWGAKNYHDSNYLTFHRVRDFRSLKMGGSPADLEDRPPARP